MLEALLEGKDPAAMAQLAKGRAKKKIPQIIAALEEHQMREHHRRMIRFSLDHMAFLEEQLTEMNQLIREKIQEAGYQEQWELLRTLPAAGSKVARPIAVPRGSSLYESCNASTEIAVMKSVW